ncbi:MAG TPA: hypothetical protein PLL92_05365 [Alicycliphilus sp.]|nr:hypothetical protein [Alicycliphilus sp.]
MLPPGTRWPGGVAMGRACLAFFAAMLVLLGVAYRFLLRRQGEPAAH